MSDDKIPSARDDFGTGATLEIPLQFIKALSIDHAANDAFDRLPAGDQREFIDWIVEDRTADGRTRRATEALGKLRSGKRARD